MQFPYGRKQAKVIILLSSDPKITKLMPEALENADPFTRPG
jgi:hypothetical protein